MKHNLTFSEMSLDRASSKRKNASWLKEQLHSNKTEFIPVWQEKFWFNEQQSLILSAQEIQTRGYLTKDHEIIFLGLEGEKPVFALDFSSLIKESAESLFSSDYHIVDVRRALSLLTSKQIPIFGLVKALSYWHRHHQHCGRCGCKTSSYDGGHMRKCTSDVCGHSNFPRTDPAVIMLVEYQPENGPAKCLLAQHHAYSKQVVSTLAGFVDPGETFEEAVVREVQEEAGVKVSQVKYMASQPWPFPSSVMIGFFAQTNDPTINVDNEEIADAQWFTAEQVRTFGNWGDKSEGYQLPRKESIARFLIDDWLAKQP